MKDKLMTAGLFTAVCTIWGTTWMAMEIAVESVPPIVATGLRFLISAPCILLLAKLANVPLLFPREKRGFMLAVAVFYFAIPFTLMIVGEQYISSGLASIIFANMPLAVLAVSMISLGLRLSLHQLIGLGVAVSSLCLILSNELEIGSNNGYAGMVALIAAVAIHAVMYLGLIASVGGIVAYFRLNQVTSPFNASLCFLIFPVVALCLDAGINNNHLSPLSLQLLAPLFIGIIVAKLNKLPSIRALVRSK